MIVNIKEDVSWMLQLKVSSKTKEVQRSDHCVLQRLSHESVAGSLSFHRFFFFPYLAEAEVMSPQVEKTGHGDGDVIGGVKDEGEAEGFLQRDIIEYEGIGHRGMVGADIAGS